MNLECHEDDCPKMSFTATSCACGFVVRLLRGEADVTAGERGQGGRERYVATRYDGPDACVPMSDVDGFLAALKARCASSAPAR